MEFQRIIRQSSVLFELARGDSGRSSRFLESGFCFGNLTAIGSAAEVFVADDPHDTPLCRHELHVSYGDGDDFRRECYMVATYCPSVGFSDRGAVSEGKGVSGRLDDDVVRPCRGCDHFGL